MSLVWEFDRVGAFLSLASADELKQLAALLDPSVLKRFDEAREQVKKDDLRRMIFGTRKPSIATANIWLKRMHEETLQQGKDFPNEQRMLTAKGIQYLREEFGWTASFVNDKTGENTPCTVCVSRIPGKNYLSFFVRACGGKKTPLSQSRNIPHLVVG